ncbi:MAG: hypothetical protein ACPG8W_22900 [Candidatus Promineifilaceae bacterium]
MKVDTTQAMRFSLPWVLFLLLLISAETATAANSIDPYAGAPECAHHNASHWHGHWDAARGCYYTHEHKDNPGVILPGMTTAERAQAQAVLNVFGPPGQWFGGTSISYPWQTFQGAGPSYMSGPSNPAVYENAHKHAGYGWIVRTNIPSRGAHYIKDYRLQYHAIFASPGARTRYHSYSLEANICKTSEGCRIVRTGGWLDFGHLKISGRVIPLPDQDGDGARQRLHTSYRYGSSEFARQDNFRTAAVWYGLFTYPDHAKKPWAFDQTGKPFRLLAVALETMDAWAEVNASDPSQHELFCPAFDCNKNGSTVKMHRLTLDIIQPYYDGFTDRFGLPNANCTAVGLDCIPTSISAGPRVYANVNDWFLPLDYDRSPEGVWWLKYPN